MRLALLCLLLAPALAGAAPPQDYAAAKSAADADESSLAGTDRQALLKAQQAFIDAATQACATDRPNPDLSPFVVVMALDAAGRTMQTWRRGESPLSVCMQHFASQATVFVPPRAPFYSSIEISFEK
jgi:hypothetical protein